MASCPASAPLSAARAAGPMWQAPSACCAVRCALCKTFIARHNMILEAWWRILGGAGTPSSAEPRGRRLPLGLVVTARLALASAPAPPSTTAAPFQPQ